MEQYISKSALLAEIEKLQLCTMDEHMNFYSEAAEGEYHALSKLESFLDTLEVKEVDLKKEIDLDAVIDAYMDKNFGKPWDGARPVGSFELAIMAEHFFGLGLKAQKGE